MQEREGLHRRCGELIRACRLAAVVLMCGSAACRADTAEAWTGEPLPGFSILRFDPPGGRSGTALLFLSIANPYGIEGLVASRLDGGLASGRFDCGLSWSRLSHALYREDRLSTAIALEVHPAGVLVGAAPALARREPAGFAAERSASISLLAAWMHASGVSARFAVPVHARGAPPPRFACSCDILIEGLAAGLGCSSPDGIEMEYRLAAGVPLGARMSLHSAYEFRSGELSFGVLARPGRFVIGFSWSVNPSLGVSASAGIGRRWRW